MLLFMGTKTQDHSWRRVFVLTCFVIQADENVIQGSVKQDYLGDDLRKKTYSHLRKLERLGTTEVLN